MSDIFISYSRHDGEFVGRLHNALTKANRVVWVDWEGIPRGEDWWKEIELGIEAAEAFVCVISEHWLTSEICHRELSYARQHHKRIIPIIRQEVRGDIEKRVKGTWMDQAWEQAARDNWETLRHLNWIFFYDDQKFETEFAALLKALDEDQSHIKAHTRYQVNALEWERSECNPSFLLSGDGLTFAEQWLETSKDKQPTPTALQREFISASREAENTRKAQEAARERQIKRFRIAAVIASMIGVAALIATSIAVPTTVNAVNSNATAVAQVATAGVGLATATSVAGRASELRTEVFVAGTTLTPVPPTLTAVAEARMSAERQQAIAALLANASLSMTEGSSAISIGDQIVAQYPQEPMAYVARGILYRSLADYEAAIADFSHAIDLDPETLEAYLNRGIVYADQAQFDDAIDDYSRAVELDPEIASIYARRGNAYLQQGRLDDAFADYERAIDLDPADYSTYFDRGVAYASQEQFEDAIEDFSRVIDLNPQYHEAYYNRGFAYFQLDQLERAIDDLSYAIDHELPGADAYVYRAIAYYRRGQLENAMEDYAHAIELEPENASLYVARGAIAYSLEKMEIAANDLSMAESLGAELSPEIQFMQFRATLLLTPTPSGG